MLNKINNRFLAAPMAGITDSPFRKILRLFFNGLVFTEMVSVMALKYNFEREMKILKFDDIERPLGIQIFGKSPEEFFNAASIIRRLKPDVLDINMGCPARKVVSSGSGSALLRDRVLAKEIISSSLEGFKGPVSLKMRILDSSDIEKTLAFIDYAVPEGINFVTLHLRTPGDKFSKPVNYDICRDIFLCRKPTIVINGGIDSREKADLLFGLGAGYLMIGHAMLGKPQVFQYLEGRYTIRADDQILRKLIDYIDEKDLNQETFNTAMVPYLHLLLMLKEKPLTGIREFRKHFCWYTKGIARSKEYRNAVFRSTDHEYVKNLVMELCKNEG